MPPITGAPTSVTAFLGRTLQGPAHEPRPIRSFAEFERDFGGLAADCPLTYAVQHYFGNGGSGALIVRVPGSAPGGAVTDGDLAGPEREAAREGLWALEKAEGFNLLCIPPLTRTQDVAPATLATALAYCRSRRALLLADPPAAWKSAAEAAAGAEGLSLGGKDAANAVLYFPRLRAPDPLNGNRLQTFAPCGAVAGVIARTDAAGNVWTSPAGPAADLRGGMEPANALDSADSALLARLGVNPIRQFPEGSPFLWSAHTLQGADALASDWKYVPVRRLALFIETSVYRGTLWAVSEPNAEPLWARLRAEAAAFLHGLFVQGAFPSPTPQDAYFVKCGADTMTQDDLDEGRLIILVGIAPLQPAEFVLIRIGQWMKRPPP